jgi:hypothetical protein
VFHSNTHDLIIASSHFLKSVEYVFACSSIFHFNFSSSSPDTGTGIFQAHKNQVTLGVFLTIYQLSLFTII